MRAIKLFIAVSSLWPTIALATSDKDAVKALIKAIKQGDDLAAGYPTAITPREIASVKRVASCSAINLMKQSDERYTVVWDCGSRGALGMEVGVLEGKVTTVKTFAIEARPNA